MITRLNLKNFRCFRDFQLDNIMPVTLISGKNNVGKSTLLEGVYLLFNRLDSTVFFKLSAFRENLVTTHPQIFLEPLFNGLDMSKELSVSVLCDGIEQILRIRKDEKSSTSTFINKQNDMKIPSNPIGNIANIHPLKMFYSRGDYQESGRYEFNFPNITLHLESEREPAATYVHYIGPNVHENSNSISEWFGKLDLTGEKSRLVETLRLMDSRITDLFTIVSGGGGHIYANMSSGLKIPLRAMGEGMNKLLLIALVMLIHPGCVVLIDEVENGFHHSFHEKFWELVFRLSLETKCRIFATTHSYECISGAIDASSEKSNDDDFLYVRLGFQGEDIVPYTYSKELLAHALRSEMEVR